MSEVKTAGFDINRFWGLIQKRRYIAIAVALLVISIFTWGSFFWPKTFEASTTVFIEKSSLLDPLIRGVGVPGNMEDTLRHLKNSLVTRNIMARVLKKLDLGVRNKKSAGRSEDLIDGIRNNLKIVTVKSGENNQTDLFTISYRGGDPKMVRDFVNTLVSEFIEESLTFRRTDASGAYDFIKKQLEEYKAKLEVSDEALKQFREKNPGVIPQNETSLAGRIESLQTSKMEAELKLKEQMKKKESLQRQLSGEKELTVAFVSRDGSPQNRLGNLNHQLILLLGKYTENYPEVVRVKAEIEELKRQIAQGKVSQTQESGAETAAMNPIYQQLKEELARTDAEVESLRARVGELGRQMRESESKLGRMPKEQQEWTKLQRDRNVTQKIYDDLLQKLESAKVSKDLEMTDKNANFRIVDPAIMPHWPVQPDRVMLILMGIGLGIVAGCAAAIGIDYLEHSFKDEEGIENELNLPVLASIPKIFSEVDVMSVKRLDKKVFTAASAYLAIVSLVLLREVLRRYMGISII
jgi:succinoglycan biosynthesis transport protein ExoP